MQLNPCIIATTTIIIIIAIIIGRGGAAVLMFSEGRLTFPHFENPCTTGKKAQKQKRASLNMKWNTFVLMIVYLKLLFNFNVRLNQK